MNVTFIMTADGTTLKDIRPFIKKNISQIQALGHI